MKPLEGEEVKPSADIIDLTELLRRSLRKGGGADAEGDKGKPAARRKAANDDEEAAPVRRAAATKASGRSTASVKPKPRKKAA
jgi:DNA end-binding protein Ku